MIYTEILKCFVIMWDLTSEVFSTLIIFSAIFFSSVVVTFSIVIVPILVSQMENKLEPKPKILFGPVLQFFPNVQCKKSFLVNELTFIILLLFRGLCCDSI